MSHVLYSEEEVDDSVKRKRDGDEENEMDDKPPEKR